MVNADDGISGIFKNAGKSAIEKNRKQIDESSPEGGCDGLDNIDKNGFRVKIDSPFVDEKKLDEIMKMGQRTMKKLGEMDTCDVDCRYNQKLLVLQKNLKSAETQYEEIPNRLRNAQKQFYLHKRGVNYTDFEKGNVDKILSDRIGIFRRKFSIYKSVLKKIDKEGDPVQKGKMIQYLNELETMYANENNHLHTQNIQDREKFKIADRNNVYYQIGINQFKKYNFMLFAFTAISTVFYFITFLYVYQEYKTFDQIISRIRILGPLLILHFVVLGVYIYISDESFIPHFNFFSSDENKPDKLNEMDDDDDSGPLDRSSKSSKGINRDRSICIGLTRSSS